MQNLLAHAKLITQPTTGAQQIPRPIIGHVIGFACAKGLRKSGPVCITAAGGMCSYYQLLSVQMQVRASVILPV